MPYRQSDGDIPAELQAALDADPKLAAAFAAQSAQGGFAMAFRVGNLTETALMAKGNDMRTFYTTVVIVAVLSIAVGLTIAATTGQYVGVFLGQLLVAALLATWYVRVKRRSSTNNE